MPQMKNDAELLAIMKMDIASIINDVTEVVQSKLKKKIETEVYNKKHPKWYVRRKEDGGLLGTFTRSSAKSAGNKIWAEISPSIGNMVNKPDLFTHGSHFWGGITDIRHLLVDIIVRGLSGPLFNQHRITGSDGKLTEGTPGWWTYPRDFWTPTVDLLYDGTWMPNKMEPMFSKKFGRQGIGWKRIK